MTSQGQEALDGEFKKQTQICLTLKKIFLTKNASFLDNN